MINRLGYRKSGEYHLIKKGDDGRSYFTFVPHPLSDNLDIGVDTELANLISIANRLLGQLEGMSSFLPNSQAIESVFMRKEALLSCRIDRIEVPLYSVCDATEKEQIKTRSIHNYISAISYNMAASMLKLLSDLGIVHQSNNLERNRDYANTEFLKCFVEDIISF